MIPKTAKYSQALKTFVKKNKVFYELPEQGILAKKYMQMKDDLKQFWNSFEYNFKSENVMNYQEIVRRTDELVHTIDQVEKQAVVSNQTESDKIYLDLLNKRKEFVEYVIKMDREDCIDKANLHTNDYDEPRNEELRKLMTTQRFWRNTGMKFNSLFDRKINWNSKVQSIGIEIEQIHRELDDLEDEKRRKEYERQRQLEQKELEERQEEFMKVHQFQEEPRSNHDYRPEHAPNGYDHSRSGMRQEDVDLSANRYGQEEFEWKEREEAEKIATLERENEELERNIRNLEEQKMTIEVRVTSVSWTERIRTSPSKCRTRPPSGRLRWSGFRSLRRRWTG